MSSVNNIFNSNYDTNFDNICRICLPSKKSKKSDNLLDNVDHVYVLTITTLMEINILLKLIKEKINQNDIFKNMYITISRKYTIDVCINGTNRGLA